jgi:hypothetical protein
MTAVGAPPSELDARTAVVVLSTTFDREGIKMALHDAALPA